MLEIETLQTFDTIYSADSVEWCQDVEHENYFVVGTYQLEEKDANDSSNNLRKGRIYLFHYDEDINVLTECQQLELPEAVLDQKWMVSQPKFLETFNLEPLLSSRISQTL